MTTMLKAIAPFGVSSQNRVSFNHDDRTSFLVIKHAGDRYEILQSGTDEEVSDEAAFFLNRLLAEYDWGCEIIMFMIGRNHFIFENTLTFRLAGPDQHLMTDEQGKLFDLIATKIHWPSNMPGSNTIH